MAANIGPKIGIDGEAQFRKEINNLIQQQKTLASEMKAVTSSFDTNDKSQEAVTAQSKILSEQISVQTQRVAKLSQGLTEAAKKFGDTDDRTLKWKQAVNEATADLNKMEGQLGSLKNEVDDVGDAMQDATESTSTFSDVFNASALVEGIKGIAEGIANIVESTNEYRKITGTLKTSSESAGYTAEQTAEAYNQLYWALGDNQATATTIANLQALNLSQKDLMNMLDNVTGAWAKYGDSIPIDGLAESVNETIRIGTVTGTFADVLNWGTKEGETFGVMLKENTEANQEWNDAVNDAVTAEDFFNLALQNATSQQERANLVAQAMASQGLADTADAWYQNNAAIVDANNAQLQMQQAMASFAETIAPAMNTLAQFTADAATKGAELAAQFKVALETGNPLAATLTGVAAAMGTMAIALSISALVDGLTKAFTLLNAAMAANPAILVVSLIAGVVAAIATLLATNEDLRNSVINVGQQIYQSVQSLVGNIVNFFTVTVPGAFQQFSANVSNIVSNVQQSFSNMASRIGNTVSNIRDSLVNGISQAVDYIKSLPSQAFNWGSDMMQQMANGITSKINGIINSVKSVANTITSYLHFSRPDVGPLREYESWMPDMISGMAKGITDNGWQLEAALNAATSHLQPNINVSGGGPSGPAVNLGGVQITVQAAPGMDVEQLAQAVAYRIQLLANQKGAAF